MTRSFVALAFSLLLGVAGLPQTPQPAATPPPTDNEVVKISTSLIQLDVTVTDKNGKIIRDLRPDEIEVYENGKKQPISGLRFVSSGRELEPVDNRAVTPATIVASPITSKLTAEQVRRSIAVVVDDLNLGYESMIAVRHALKKFVDEQMQQGDLVAILRTGAGIGAMQQFTGDKRRLHAMIDKLKYNPLGSGKMQTYDQLQPKYDARFGGRPPTAGERTLQGLKREQEDTRKSVFAMGALESVNFIVKGMQTMPGRKSIMLMTDGFRLYSEDALGFRESSDVVEALRKLVDSANRASVVIHTVEARGLETNSLTAADSTSGWLRVEIKQQEVDRRNHIEDTQEGIGYIAKQTGGTTILNTSDLSIGMRKILEDQSYYLVAYEPDDATFDSKARRYNTIEIKVNRPDASARYRSGFFGVTQSAAARELTTVGERVSSALTSPFEVSDIPLRLNALFYRSPRGGVLRSILHIRAQDLKFADEADGRKKLNFDVVAVSFGENGQLADKQSWTQSMTLKKDQFDELLKNGFVYEFGLPVKKPGGYQLRVAFRDHGSETLGTASQFVEVPDLKREDLILSGVVLENMAYTDWLRLRKNQSALEKSDPLRDTSVRQFKRGSVLNYAFSIYNAKLVGSRPKLSYQTTIFRDGKLVFEGKSQPVEVTDPSAIDFTSTLALGSDMEPGEYVLQIAITDDAAKHANSTATQIVQFEIVD